MPNSDEESLGLEDLGDHDESSLESSLASCQEEQPASNSEDSESTVREESSLGSLWADSSVESPLPSDGGCSGSQRLVTLEDSGFSLNSSCEVNLPDFAMLRRQLVLNNNKITEQEQHSRETTYISLDSENSGDDGLGPSSDFIVFHLPHPSRTKNHLLLKVSLGMPGRTSTSASAGVNERFKNNLDADAINFDKKIDRFHVACPIQDSHYDSFMNDVSHNSSETLQDGGNGSCSCSSSIIERRSTM